MPFVFFPVFVIFSCAHIQLKKFLDLKQTIYFMWPYQQPLIEEPLSQMGSNPACLVSLSFCPNGLAWLNTLISIYLYGYF